MGQSRDYPGLTPGAIPSPGNLGFTARSVTITSGPNYVSSASQTFPTVVPGVIGVTLNLQYPTEAADFVITPGPVGPTPVGPAQQQFSDITYFEDVLPYNPGVATLGQTVAIVPFHGVVSGSIFTGLARACTFGVSTPAGGTDISIVGTLDNILYNWVVNFPLAASAIASFAFGQGTVSTVGASPVTLHLCSLLEFSTTAPVDAEARLYF